MCHHWSPMSIVCGISTLLIPHFGSATPNLETLSISKNLAQKPRSDLGLSSYHRGRSRSRINSLNSNFCTRARMALQPVVRCVERHLLPSNLLHILMQCSLLCRSAKQASMYDTMVPDSQRVLVHVMVHQWSECRTLICTRSSAPSTLSVSSHDADSERIIRASTWGPPFRVTFAPPPMPWWGKQWIHTGDPVKIGLPGEEGGGSRTRKGPMLHSKWGWPIFGVCLSNSPRRIVNE